jgi:hypothetical protein
LSPIEKVELLYAFQGFTYRQELNRRDAAFNKKVPENLKIAQGDYAMDLWDEAEKIRTSCPKYEDLSEVDFLTAFWKNINFHWEAMCFTGDYDFAGTKVELDYIFSNRKELASLILKS